VLLSVKYASSENVHGIVVGQRQRLWRDVGIMSNSWNFADITLPSIDGHRRKMLQAISSYRPSMAIKKPGEPGF